MNQTQRELVTVVNKIFSAMSAPEWEKDVPTFIDTTVRPATADMLLKTNAAIRSPEMPQERKQALLRSYIYTSLVMSIGLAHGVGQTRGRLMLPFEYELDMETTKVTIQQLVNSFAGLRIGLDLRLMTRQDNGQMAAVAVEWHDTQEDTNAAV